MSLSVRRYQDAQTFVTETLEQLEKNELDHTFLIWAATKLAAQETLGNAYCGAVWKKNDDGEELMFALVSFDNDMAFPSLFFTKDEQEQQDAVRMLVDDLIQAPTTVKIIQGYDPSSLYSVKEAWESLSPSTELTTSNDPFWSYVSPPVEELAASKAVAFGKEQGFTLRQATFIELPLVVEWTVAFIEFYKNLIKPDKESGNFRDAVHFQCADELCQGNVYVWCHREGYPVGMIWRRRPMKYGSSVGYVYTPPEYRGRGYGSAMVAIFSLQELQTFQYLNLLVVPNRDPNDNLYARLGYRLTNTSIQYHISTCQQ
ncbi:hypothetical protein BDA99DRAFT_522811 [Phascolomyces articulosus]|uniref:N-acetyltransferase domain-containing protein n=1 Tax=Phascolomyces articulosus TaxID=60185 RepID=A0AAD5P9J8_9FUNG|nr:hypothetical protein BDA99DRAFT_522811 [Phascolomyces articulosus]